MKIEFYVNGLLENKKISPLLLLIYIENAFKHGINKRPESPFIKIDLSINSENILKFEVKNSKEETSSFTTGKNGIGLKNAEKRLNLLYPNRYQLEISENNLVHSVKLELDLNEQ